jgi:putative transcriptional regulator
MTKAATTKPSRLAKALIETAGDMRRGGLLDAAEHDKITMRLLHREAAPAIVEAMSAQEIRVIRTRARMSQAVFAYILNVTAGYVSQLERGAKRPTGPALALLNVIKRKGIEAVL